MLIHCWLNMNQTDTMCQKKQCLSKQQPKYIPESLQVHIWNTQTNSWRLWSFHHVVITTLGLLLRPNVLLFCEMKNLMFPFFANMQTLFLKHMLKPRSGIFLWPKLSFIQLECQEGKKEGYQ